MTSISVTHATGRVTVTIEVDGRTARITVTPERARRLAMELIGDGYEQIGNSAFEAFVDAVSGRR